MANVLLTWELGGGAGHCAKLAILANGLIDRGHHVCIAARELVTARKIFDSKAIRLFQAPFLTARPPNPIFQTRSLAHILHNNGFADFATLDDLCAAWRNIFTAARPDILICDHAPMALLASYWYPMRRVLIGTGFTVPPIVSPLPELRYWNPRTESDDLRRHENAICDRINKMLARDRVKQLDTLAQLYASADEHFLLTFRELDHYPTREKAKYWGAGSLSGGATPEWPAGKNRLFAYLKPPAANWPLTEFLHHLRESNLPAIVYIAGRDSRSFAKFESAHLQISDKHFDISRVAMHCDLAILHGTSGAATAFLLAGVPQLHMPLFLEQLILSHRVADLGAGLCVDPARPKDAVSLLMEMLQVDRFRCAAQEFSRLYAAYEPQQSANEILSRIQKLLSN